MSFIIDQRHDDGWRNSPIKYMFNTGIDVVRRRLTGPDAQLDFQILDEIAAEGGSDYYMRMVEFDLTGAYYLKTGMASSWTTDRPGGSPTRRSRFSNACCRGSRLPPRPGSSARSPRMCSTPMSAPRQGGGSCGATSGAARSM